MIREMIREMFEVMIAFFLALSAVGMVFAGAPLWLPFLAYHESGMQIAVLFAVIFWPSSAFIIYHLIAEIMDAK